MSNYLASLLAAIPTKRSVFVSYHHDNDQYYYNLLASVCDQFCQVIRDASLREPLDSEDSDYISRAIREGYITGTSCTIVLCGSETWKRKHVDWEIKPTLDKEHGLVGVLLPTNPVLAYGQGGCWHPNGCSNKPQRLQDNVDSGCAIWTNWATITSSAAKLKETVESAIGRSSALIRNSRDLMGRNLS